MSFATQLADSFVPIAAIYDDPSVSRALSWAESYVTEYCDQSFDVVEEVVTLDPKPYRAALLPSVPVIDVTLVEGLLPPPTGGSAFTWQTLTNYAWTADTGLIYDTTGEPGVSIDFGHLSWPWVNRGLRVTYSHGYETAPQPVVDVACRLAQQYLENPASVMQRRVGDTEERFSGSKGMVLGELDAMILGRYMDIGVG